MRYLRISNAGLLDVKLIALMGGTTKRENSLKIGQFGTGLKYTMAYLFRNNIDFKIFVGEKEISVTTVSENISNMDFDIIHIDGQRTSITTQMGYDWKAWMILRELWCNALDEGKAEREVCTDMYGSPDTTTFYIQITPEIKEIMDNWGKYFMPPDVHRFFDSETFSIYPTSGKLKIYKQGVLIWEAKEHNSLFSYDFKNAEINELREYTGSLSYDIVKCLANANEKTIEYFLSNVNEEQYEGKMDYNWFVSFSKTWEKVIGNGKIITKAAVEQIRARGLTIDTAKLVIVPDPVFKFLSKQFENVSALRVADKIGEFFEIYIPDMDLKIKSALAILEACGYFIDPELKFIHGVFGDKTTLARVSFDKKEILVSEQMNDMPRFEFVTMLIEENEHYRTEMSDCSREFQQHFIDMYAKTLLEKHEIRL